VSVESVDEARERLRPHVERAEAFTGWMPDVHTRPLGPRQSWDYMARARHLMASASSMLDMGTGGGERFGELLDGYGGRAVATEEWMVNVPIAAAHLKPLGADTVHCRSTQLPVAGDSFDLVLNRHEDLWPVDVARVLKPGGTVLTQQAWMIWKELNRFIPRRIFLEDLFERYRDGFAAGGLEVLDARAADWPSAYQSLGDFVYMCCIAPWEVPEFDPLGRDLEALLALEREQTTPDGLVLTEGSFIIEARKPAF
jgi:SAM-dependent methyltransferase